MPEEESFKVTDRRGRGREADPPEPATPPAPETPRAPDDPRDAPSGFAGASSSQPDLSALFVMLASSALVNLGEGEDPATGERYVDIDQAREAIDLLEVLRDKTAGNRTDAESRLLEQILYDLRMRFVDVSAKLDQS